MSGSEDQEGGMALPLSQLPSSVRDAVRQRTQTMLGNNGNDSSWNESSAFMTFSNGGTILRAGIRFPGMIDSGDLFGFPTGIGPSAKALPLDHRGLALEVRRMGKTAPRNWRILADFQNSRVWNNDPPSAPVKNNTIERRADVLKWLGDKANLEFVADYYSRPCQRLSLKKKVLPLTRPLDEELNNRVAEEDCSWKQRGDKIYLFRDNRWYRDDRLEVPNSLLRPWIAKHKLAASVAAPPPPNRKQGGPDTADTAENEQAVIALLRRRLDWEGEVTQKLSHWQIGNGLKWAVDEDELKTKQDDEKRHPELAQMEEINPNFAPLIAAPFIAASDFILPEYELSRFYGNLAAPERDLLLENKLPFFSLTPLLQKDASYLSPGLSAIVAGGGAPLLGIKPAMKASTIGYYLAIPLRLTVSAAHD